MNALISIVLGLVLRRFFGRQPRVKSSILCLGGMLEKYRTNKRGPALTGLDFFKADRGNCHFAQTQRLPRKPISFSLSAPSATLRESSCNSIG